jgi:hypothetical protein
MAENWALSIFPRSSSSVPLGKKDAKTHSSCLERSTNSRSELTRARARNSPKSISPSLLACGISGVARGSAPCCIRRRGWMREKERERERSGRREREEMDRRGVR